jgi:energy-converting hydrogenase Eha subunit E
LRGVGIFAFMGFLGVCLCFGNLDDAFTCVVFLFVISRKAKAGVPGRREMTQLKNCIHAADKHTFRQCDLHKKHPQSLLSLCICILTLAFNHNLAMHVFEQNASFM